MLMAILESYLVTGFLLSFFLFLLNRKVKNEYSYSKLTTKHLLFAFFLWPIIVVACIYTIICSEKS